MVARRWKEAAVLVFLLGGLVSLLISYDFVLSEEIGPSSSEQQPTKNNSVTTNTNTNTNTTTLLRFTQFWSTGHVGTRFLAGLLASPDHFGNDDATSSSKSSDRLVWLERELPNLNGEDDGWARKLSLRQLRDVMAESNIGRNEPGRRIFERRIKSDPDRWYGGLKIKRWNLKGKNSELRAYLKDERLPALLSIAERHRGDDGGDGGAARHFIKVGHTAVFFDLEEIYGVYSDSEAEWTDPESTVKIEVDYVRVRRKRIDVAASFAASPNRPGPVGGQNTIENIVTNPTMKTAVFRLESSEGILPDRVWEGWTIFQRYLWFVDEVEARWVRFREKRPDVPTFELRYGEDGSMSYSAVDELAVSFLGYDDPVSPYASGTDKQSHYKKKTEEGSSTTDKKKKVVVGGLDREEQIRQAIEYAEQAPWCLQYVGDDDEGRRTRRTLLLSPDDDDDDDDIPRLDCSPEAF